MHYSFDFDYTLADSSEGTIICVNHALLSVGYDTQQPNAIRQTIGLSLPRTLQKLTGENKVGVATRFQEMFLKKADEVMLDHIHFYDGVATILRRLKEKGNYVSIVSTKYRHRITQALRQENLESLVDDIVGGDCVDRNKPDPEGLLLAINTSGFPKKDTIYIGDSVSDGECAYRAGVRFIASLTGVTKSSELTTWFPVAVISDIAALAEHNFERSIGC